MLEPSRIAAWLRYLWAGFVLMLEDDPAPLAIVTVGTFTLCGVAYASGKGGIYLIAVALVLANAWRIAQLGKHITEQDSSAG